MVSIDPLEEDNSIVSIDILEEGNLRLYILWTGQLWCIQRVILTEREAMLPIPVIR